ncbi:MAG: hypothetical protein ACI8RD_000955 [Bacillariaceae sp.]|jgi:hypothetical protein
MDKWNRHVESITSTLSQPKGSSTKRLKVQVFHLTIVFTIKLAIAVTEGNNNNNEVGESPSIEENYNVERKNISQTHQKDVIG